MARRSNETIDRKDVLHEIQEFRREFALHLEDANMRQRRADEYKIAFDRHMEIYANNGKESARLATNVENLIEKMNEVKAVVTDNEKRSDGQGVDVTAIKSDVDWLKRFFWIVMTSAIGSLIVAIFNIIMTFE